MEFFIKVNTVMRAKKKKTQIVLVFKEFLLKKLRLSSLFIDKSAFTNIYSNELNINKCWDPTAYRIYFFKGVLIRLFSMFESPFQSKMFEDIFINNTVKQFKPELYQEMIFTLLQLFYNNNES